MLIVSISWSMILAILPWLTFQIVPEKHASTMWLVTVLLDSSFVAFQYVGMDKLTKTFQGYSGPLSTELEFRFGAIDRFLHDLATYHRICSSIPRWGGKRISHKLLSKQNIEDWMRIQPHLPKNEGSTPFRLLRLSFRFLLRKLLAGILGHELLGFLTTCWALVHGWVMVWRGDCTRSRKWPESEPVRFFSPTIARHNIIHRLHYVTANLRETCHRFLAQFRRTNASA
jgi:hypothetical protein